MTLRLTLAILFLALLARCSGWEAWGDAFCDCMGVTAMAWYAAQVDN